MFKKLGLLLPLLAGALVNGYASPGGCSGNCWAHDPCIIQRASDGAYFMFNTGGGIPVSKSKSLKGPWVVEGQALTSGSKINIAGKTDLWAPDVTLVDGTYYMYYSVSTFGSQTSALGLATSKTMEVGSWTDHGSVGVSSSSVKPYNSIDANLIQVGSSWYLNFGSFFGGIYQTKMASTPTKTAGSAAYNLAYNATGIHALEGSYMFKYGSYYYLLVSSGICCGYDTALPAKGEQYKIMMGRSKSSTGSFVDKNGKALTDGGGSILLQSHSNVYGPGGQGVFTDSSLGLVLYYHWANLNRNIGDGSYLLGWNALTWSNGWPIV